MPFVAAIVLGVLAVEVLRRLPLLRTARGLLGANRKVLRLTRSRRLSDDHKQRLTLLYACRSFRASGALALQLLALGASVGLAFWLLARVLGLDPALLGDAVFLVVLTLGSLAWAWLRKRLV